MYYHLLAIEFRYALYTSIYYTFDPYLEYNLKRCQQNVQTAPTYLPGVGIRYLWLIISQSDFWTTTIDSGD